MLAAAADHGSDLGEIRRERGRGHALGLGWPCSMVSSNAATGWPIAAQSGVRSSRARSSASRRRL